MGRAYVGSGLSVFFSGDPTRGHIMQLLGDVFALAQCIHDGRHSRVVAVRCSYPLVALPLQTLWM